jgi:hypothetical protein
VGLLLDKMFILCFAKRIFFLIWDILKCQPLKLTRVVRRTMPTASWGQSLHIQGLCFLLASSSAGRADIACFCVRVEAKVKCKAPSPAHRSLLTLSLHHHSVL